MSALQLTSRVLLSIRRRVTAVSSLGLGSKPLCRSLAEGSEHVRTASRMKLVADFVLARHADRLILRGFIFSLFFLSLAKIGGALKEVILAHAYGTATVLDAYSLGFSIAGWPIAIAAMCANSILIPAFVAEMRASGNAVVNVRGLLIRLFPASVLVAVATYALLRFGVGPFLASQAMAEVLSAQALGLAIMVPPGIAAAVLAARLMAAGRQISALFEVIPSLSVGLCVMAFGLMVPAGRLLAWATGVGMLFYFVALALADRSALNVRGTTQLHIGGLQQSFVVVLLAQIVFTLGGGVFDQVAAASMPQEQNAALAYANRLLMLMTGLGVTAIARAVMPVLSDAWSAGPAEGRMLLHRWLAILFACGIGIALVAYAMSPVAVRLLFQHGSFTSTDTRSVTVLLQAGLLQLPFYFASVVLAQAAVVQRRFGLLLTANLLAVAMKILLVVVLLPVYGVTLLMYATAAMYFVSLAVLGGGQLLGRGPR